jgi:hypothetical protein
MTINKNQTMKKLQLISILVLFGFIFTGVSAQIQNPDSPIPSDPNIKIGKLDNGLTY